MYPSHLGKFNIPANDPAWYGKFTYTPEPPITTRSSMNPWETERQRTLWMTEEKAWADIVPQQVKFRTLVKRMQNLMDQYNDLINQLEGLIGKPMGLEKMVGFTQKIPFMGGMVGGVMGMIDSVLGLITGGLFGGSAKKKKAQAQQIMNQMEAVQTQMAATQQQLYAVQAVIEGLVNGAEAVRAGQAGAASAAMDQTNAAATVQASLDSQRGSVLRERIRQIALMTPPGGAPHAATDAL